MDTQRLEAMAARLQISRETYESNAYKRGREAGERWAERVAEYPELKRLSDNCDRWLDGRVNAPDAAYTIAEVILGEYAGPLDHGELLWQPAFGDDWEEMIREPNALAAFLIAAANAFEEVADILHRQPVAGD